MVSERQRIAAHEAGHALAALHYGLPVTDTWVDDYQCETRIDPAAWATTPPADLLFLVMAGRESETLLCGANPAPHQHHSGDYDQTQQFAVAAVGEANAGWAIAEARQKAMDFAMRHHDLIAELGAQLTAAGRVDATVL